MNKTAQQKPKEVKIWMGTTKGELIKICYDNNKKELGNVDVNLPTESYNELRESNKMPYWYVMDYNKSSLGEMRCLKDVAAEHNVKLVY